MNEELKKKLTEGATHVEEVYFKVDFEGMTHLIRDIWSEGRYTVAIDILDSMNIPPEFHEDIIHGKLKIIQDPDGIEGVTGTLAHDNWKVNLDQCAFGFYPKFIDMPNMAEKMVTYYREYESKVIRDARMLYNDYMESFHALDKERMANEFFQYPERIQEEIDPDGNVVNGRFMPLLPNPRLNLPSVEEFVERQLELDKIETVEPDPNFKSKYGIITDDGKFYGCGWMEHDWLCNRLGKSKDDAMNVWIIISKRGGSTDFNDIIFETFARSITQRQMDTVFEFCLAHELEMPKELQRLEIK